VSKAPIRCVLIVAHGDGRFTLPNGDVVTESGVPVGAMWNAPWHRRKGADGRAIVVRVPGLFDWALDGRCSNCGRPDDDVHRCWVRHGDPPDLTIDKNGDTCAAGAGSIIVPGWHGKLIGGFLEEC